MLSEASGITNWYPLLSLTANLLTASLLTSLARLSVPHYSPYSTPRSG